MIAEFSFTASVSAAALCRLARCHRRASTEMRSCSFYQQQLCFFQLWQVETSAVKTPDHLQPSSTGGGVTRLCLQNKHTAKTTASSFKRLMGLSWSLLASEHPQTTSIKIMSNWHHICKDLDEAELWHHRGWWKRENRGSTCFKKIDASRILFTIFCSVESYTYVACLCLCHFLRSLLL